MPQVPFDVAIVGSGPAGMFAALELVRVKPGSRVVLFEKGPLRLVDEKKNLTCGWGGSGAFSDGKLNHTWHSGGQLIDFFAPDAFDRIMLEVDRLYLEFGGDPKLVYASSESIEDLRRRAMAADLELVHFPIRHLGTDKSRLIVEAIRQYLEKGGVEIRTDCGVSRINPGFGMFEIATEDGQTVMAKKIIVCPGRGGAEWFQEEARRLGLEMENNGVDIGVRVEVRDEIMKPVTDLLYEMKVLYNSKTFRDRVRTFCMCPSGFVAIENYRGLTTVNGHSAKDVKSHNTNFAILVTKTFTQPFNNPLEYARSVSGLANLLAGGSVLVQALGDLRDHRRSTPEKIADSFVRPTLKEAVPGDISLALPHRHLVSIIEILDAMDKVVPGVASDSTLLYATEVKFYSNRVKVKHAGFETFIPGLYVAGDGSGYTRGLMQSSMHGVIVARHIAKNL
ncbi:MAG: FAD-dependent oxidoreductase [bacterium]|nr:FAD-dependent oxidoreductase [bacterium]